MKHIGRLVEKFVIGLVEDHHDMLRDALHETVDVLLEDHRACRVVRIGNENFFGPRRDRPQQAIKIGDEIRIRHVDNLRAEELSHQPVNGKGMLRHHHLVTGLQISMPQEFDDLVGAIAQDDIGHAKPQLLGHRLAQVIASAIRVKVCSINRVDHRLAGGGRRTKRVLVRGQFDDLAGRKTQLPRQVLDRLPRFVSDQITELRVGIFPHAP